MTVSSARRGAHRAPAAHQAAWAARTRLLQETLAKDATDVAEVPAQAWPEPFEALRGLLDPTDRSHVWLALAVLSGRLPARETVVETAREAEFDPAALWRAVARETTAESAAATVRLAVDEVLVDLAHTASTILATGIQRVARETARRWIRERDVTPVSWTRDFLAIRELTDVERERILSATAAEDVEDRPEATVVVPWRSTYLVPELAAEPHRSARLLALAELTPNRTGVIGFDCVPITSAETTQRGFAGVFAGNLAAVRHFDRLAAISGAAATEYEGWRSGLAAIGLHGPEIRAVHLPVEAAQPSADEIAAARSRFVVGGLPLVLVVGSHEPRKNHMAVLHAAELLWREGLQFSLSFVGGNSWGSGPFVRRLAELQRVGRPVDTASRLSDPQLWAAYTLARCTVFPSLNEGFGLPVAESLAMGTPAVTSDFGSMAEIAADGGALTVDPHDDAAIAAAIRTLLTDDTVHGLLSEAAAKRPPRTWDAYATEVWDFLVAPGA